MASTSKRRSFYSNAPNSSKVRGQPSQTKPDNQTQAATPPPSKPLGDLVPEVDCSFPAHVSIPGKHISLHPMRPDLAENLWSTFEGTENETLFTYMPYGPFKDYDSFQEHITTLSKSTDPQFYVIRDSKSGKLVGQTSHLNINTKNRTIEIGHVLFSSSLQRTPAATEAFYLMANKAFNDGFRRLEWKCDANNAASKRAALRLGHTFEGVFRQHMIVRGRNRDSAWFSILDSEWPVCKKALEAWLEEGNFDEDGKQVKDLRVIREELS